MWSAEKTCLSSWFLTFFGLSAFLASWRVNSIWTWGGDIDPKKRRLEFQSTSSSFHSVSFVLFNSWLELSTPRNKVPILNILWIFQPITKKDEGRLRRKNTKKENQVSGVHYYFQVFSSSKRAKYGFPTTVRKSEGLQFRFRKVQHLSVTTKNFIETCDDR